MDNIVESIYKSCDQNNTNNVSVSSLIEFIKPYMSENLDELVDLQSKLDPNSSNPSVDYEFFQHVMSDWIANIQEDDINSSLAEVTINLSQSLNSNNTSIVTEDMPSDNNNTNELTLQEQNDTLKQQLNRALNDLELAKMQLAACEDQNELLLADLNSRCKLKNKERSEKERCEEIARETEEVRESRYAVMKKCEHLERLVSNYEKQQNKWMDQIGQLESENLNLTKKIETLEKTKRKDRKSLTELNESLENKETEISSLMEIINDLKIEMEEKTYLINFYMNEHKFLKQKTRDIETTLKNSYNTIPEESEMKNDNVFNTPKLLRQLECPLSPMKDTPTSKRFDTSTPYKSSLTTNSIVFDSLLNNLDIETTLRKPHKSLKEELTEISSEPDEIEILKKTMKQKEDVNDLIWENMKKLSKENKALSEYKKKMSERENSRLLNEKYNMKKRVTDDALIQLTSDINRLDNNLRIQKILSLRAQKKVKTLGRTMAVIQSKQAEKRVVDQSTGTEDTRAEKLMVNRSTGTEENGTEKLMVNQSTGTEDVKAEKFMVNKSTETENVNETVAEPGSKRSNYGKQQIKIERLIEKQEKLQKELSKERKINTKMCAETETIKKTIESLRKEFQKQTVSLKDLHSEKNTLTEQLDESKAVIISMTGQIVHLKDDIAKLESEKDELEKCLRCSVDQLAVETKLNNDLQIDRELLLKKECQLEAKIKEQLLLQYRMTKQLMDAKTLHNFFVKQLQEELAQRRSEVEMMKQKNDSHFELISTCNKDLRRTITHLFDCCKLEDSSLPSQLDLHNYVKQETNECVTSLENQINLLKGNITVVVSLVEELCERQLLNVTKACESCDDDFPDDYLELSSNNVENFAQDLPEIILTCDSFLDSLQFENVDWRHLSTEEMDEKLANLALLFTLDVPTLKTRNALEEDKFHQLATTFFSHLNYSIHLLNSKNKKKVSNVVATHLKMLRDISKDLFEVAMRCGVFLYEKNTTNCWTSLINYVAILKQENEKRNKRSSRRLEVKVLPSFSLNGEEVVEAVVSPTSVRSCCRGFIFWFCSVFLAFFVFLFYVEQLCSKNGKWTCPFQWIISLFVEETYVCGRNTKDT